MEFLSIGILIVQFCNKIHGLLGFKFSKLTYRKKCYQLPIYSMLWDPSLLSAILWLSAKQARLVVSVWLSTQFWLFVLTQFCGFLFGKIHSFAERNLRCRGTFSFLALFAIEEWTIFEDKFFMLFKFFLKKKRTVKISVYKLASVCYSFFRLKWAKVIIKLIDIFFPVLGLHSWWQHTLRKTINALLLFCNLLNKKLLKANLITSSSFVTFFAKIRKTSVNLYWRFQIF